MRLATHGVQAVARAIAIKETLGIGDARTDKINTALKNEGLKEATGVTEPVTGSSNPQDSNDSDDSMMLIAVIVSVVVGVMMVGITIWHCLPRRSAQKIDPDIEACKTALSAAATPEVKGEAQRCQK